MGRRLVLITLEVDLHVACGDEVCHRAAHCAVPMDFAEPRYKGMSVMLARGQLELLDKHAGVSFQCN